MSLELSDVDLLWIFPGGEFIDADEEMASLSDTMVWSFSGERPDFGGVAAAEDFARRWASRKGAP